MGTTPDPVASPTPTDDNTDSFATKSELNAVADRVTALEGAPGAAPVPTNPGEVLTPTPSNPELTPDSPGVEPGSAPAPSAGDNAPASTDPEGDTSKQNAPQPPAPEPEGLNTTTNPGTSSDGTQGQSQVETPDPAAPSEPQPTQPVSAATDDTVYVYVGEDPSYTWPAGYVKSDLETPDGKPLYRFTDDVVGKPAVGAVDGVIGIYAAEVLIPAPSDQAAS